MATQSTVVRAHTHRSILTVLGLATILTTVLSGGWLLRPSMPTRAPVTPVLVAAGAPDRPIAHRFFADEIAGASALDLTGAASEMQPEWEPVQLRRTAPVVVGPQPGVGIANRFFADEISAGTGIADWTLPEVPVTLSLYGPR